MGYKYGKNYAMLTWINRKREWLYYHKTNSISAKNITKDKGDYSIMIEMSTNKKRNNLKIYPSDKRTSKYIKENGKEKQINTQL